MELLARSPANLQDSARPVEDTGTGSRADRHPIPYVEEVSLIADLVVRAAQG